MFVTTIDGRRTVHSRLTTNSTQVQLTTLHNLLRRQLIDYEENRAMMQFFPATFWDVVLTDKGRQILEASQ